MLYGAAAAAGEIAAKRIDTFGARLLDLHEATSAIAALGLDDLAGQRERHIERRAIDADAIAAVTDMVDSDTLSHAAHP